MFFVLDENHNLIEAYDKEGVLAVLAQAIKDGSLSGISADAGFVSKLKCCVGGATHPVAFVTQAKYNELQASESLIKDCIYYITDDTSADDLDALLEELTAKANEFTQFKSDVLGGNQTVGKAKELSGMTAINGTSSFQCGISETGIYLASIGTVNSSELFSYKTGLICIPSLDCRVEGSCNSLDQLVYLPTSKEVAYLPYSSTEKTQSIKLYRIGDI